MTPGQAGAGRVGLNRATFGRGRIALRLDRQPAPEAGRLAAVDTDQASTLAPVDPESPSVARIYDYWLGGDTNYRVDRDVAERAVASMPGLHRAIHENRAFLRRVVRDLVHSGITQFLDLGSGIPTVGNVHEVAQRADPDSRVVYVDWDPVATADGQRLLAGNRQATQILADLRDARAVLEHEQTRGLLDLDMPVAVLMIAVMHFVPDCGDPAGIVQDYRRHMAPGSYLALSHAAPDPHHPDAQVDMEREYNKRVGANFVHRTESELRALLGGFTLVDPGIVPVNRWKPEAERDGEMLLTYGLLARRDYD